MSAYKASTEDFGEEPSNITLRATWLLELNAKDAVLVLKALGGRLTMEEAVAAQELGNRLTVIRARQADALARMMATHASKVQP